MNGKLSSRSSVGGLLHRRSVQVAAVVVAALGGGGAIVATTGLFTPDTRGNQISAVVHEVWDGSNDLGAGLGPDYIRVHLRNNGPVVGNLRLVIHDDGGVVYTEYMNSGQCTAAPVTTHLSTKPTSPPPATTLTCGALGHGVTREITIRGEDMGFDGDATVSVVGKPAATVRYAPDEGAYASSAGIE